MADFTPSSYIIAIFIFVLVIVGGVALISGLKETDSSFVDEERFSDFNKTFNKYEEILDISNKTQQNIENMENADFGIFGVLNSLINQAWQFLRLLISSLGFMGSSITGLTALFGVPAWIPAIIIGIIVVALGFAIYSIIFQRNA